MLKDDLNDVCSIKFISNYSPLSVSELLEDQWEDYDEVTERNSYITKQVLSLICHCDIFEENYENIVRFKQFVVKHNEEKLKIFTNRIKCFIGIISIIMKYCCRIWQVYRLETRTFACRNVQSGFIQSVLCFVDSICTFTQISANSILNDFILLLLYYKCVIWAYS